MAQAAVAAPGAADAEERIKRSMETKISQFVADQILVDQVETGFNLFLKHRPDLKEANFETAEAEFFKVIDNVPPKYLDEAAKFYMKQTGKLNNACVLKRVFAFMQSAVNKHKIEPRVVCDAILKSEHLTYENSALWIVSFQLVRQIVGGVDYKGVREIMKLCIEKAHGLPVNIDKSIAPQLDALKEVLEYIFNRNASLLPGYFIVNEILKSYPDTSHWPHWSLVPLVSKFVDSFRPAAAIVSCVNLQHLFPVVEYMGRANAMSTWKLEHSTLKFLLKMTLNTTTYDRILPYSKEYFKPQPRFLRYLLTQTYSRDLINHVLSLKKPTKETPPPGVCIPLQTQVVHCLLELMRFCEQDIYPTQLINHLFRLLSSNLIFFVLYQYITFPNIISELADGIQAENLKKGRDKLMLLLLQFISGSIQKNPPQDFVEVLRLFSMYPETVPLPVPATDSSECIEKLAASGIYIHLKKKAMVEKTSFGFRLPVALVKHLEYLEATSQHPVSMDPLATNYIVPLLCNSFSTTQDLFQAPMLALYEAVGGSSQSGGGVPGQGGSTPMPGVHVSAALPVQPLHMDILDSLSVHSKMSLLHRIVTHILNMATNKSTIAISPGMVETYSRLLVYLELETLGIKSFLDKVLPKVFSCNAWGFLYTLLEIFSYRVHHVQAHYRLSLLTTLHGISSHAPNHAQLTLMLESSALRLITGMGNYEMNSPKPQPGTTAKPNYTLYGDSEELNRMVILTLARTIHIGGLDNNSGPWLKEVVTGIMQSTPHTLPSHTLKHFPQALLDLVNDMPPVRDTANQIRRNVDEDWNLWNQLTNEQEKINHFSQPNTNATFLCLLWKMIMESDESARNIPVAAYKVLERTGAKQLSAHLRTFCDYLVLEFSKSTGGGHVTKAIDATNTMIWKYNVITLDRFVLSMVLRPHEGNEAQVCFFIIQVLLLKPVEFRTRVNEVCRTMNPDHHLQQNWHEKHMEIHKKFPEQFSLELSSEESQSVTPTLPIYYGNVCLRFLPVFDVVVHRYIELPPVQKSLETMFTHLGCLFKFHDKPITYLYNTFFYYETSLRARRELRQLIVMLVDQALKEVRPANWAFTQEISANYICPEEERRGADGEERETWKPTPEYFHNLVGRMVGAMDTKVQAFPRMDWRFSEFPNEGAHGLYVTCVELMILPMDPVTVGERLVDVILENSCHIPGEKLPEWINAVGLLLSYLPPVFWDGLHNRILSLLQSDLMTKWDEVTGGAIPMQIFDFANVDSLKMDTRAAYLLAVIHSTWQHAGFNQLCGILELLRDRIKPVVTTEEQLMFILHMVGPFLQRLYTDKIMKVLFNVTIQIYELILRVDQACPHLKYMDTVCDLLYHIKYQFTGDSVKADAERVVKELRPALQLRLRFIAQVPINKTE